MHKGLVQTYECPQNVCKSQRDNDLRSVGVPKTGPNTPGCREVLSPALSRVRRCEAGSAPLGAARFVVETKISDKTSVSRQKSAVFVVQAGLHRATKAL